METVYIKITVWQWDEIKAKYIDRVETQWKRSDPGIIKVICDRETRKEIWDIFDSRYSRY